MDSEDMKPKNSHRPLNVLLFGLTVAVFIFTVTLNYISPTPAGKASGIFTNSTSDVSRLNELEVTPAGWTFSIWVVIYIWQFMWMIYALTSMFRKNPQGGPLYTHPELLTPLFYKLYLLNLGCNVAWLVVYDRMYIDWSLIPIFALTIALYCCLAIVHVRLNRHGKYMQESGCLRKDIWFTRFLVQNGLASYATWATIASWLTMAQVLAYRAGLGQSLSSTIFLSILTVQLTSWFVLDVFVLDRYTRYLFVPYVVVCFALAGSLAKNYDPTKNNSIATVALIAVASLALVIKIIMMFYRHCTRPLFTVDGDEYKKGVEDTQLEQGM